MESEQINNLNCQFRYIFKNTKRIKWNKKVEKKEQQQYWRPFKKNDYARIHERRNNWDLNFKGGKECKILGEKMRKKLII